MREGKFPVNHQILYNLQEVFNLMPNLNSEKVIKSFLTSNNDVMLSTYIASVSATVLNLHKLINNRLAYMESTDEAKTVDKNVKKVEGKKEEKKDEKK